MPNNQYNEFSENDTNSTYCPKCNCRITIGRCQHGVESPRETRKREAMEREYRERDMDTIREETQQERAFCNEADEIQRGEQRRRERNSKRDDTLTPRIDPREGPYVESLYDSLGYPLA